MIVTSDSTALIAIMIAANTGRSMVSRPLSASGEVRIRLLPASRPRPTNISTGISTVPSAPSGSRMKILISSQVSFNSPRHISSPQSPSSVSVANRVAGDREEHVLERRQQRAEVGRADPVLGQALDHVGHEVFAAAADGEALIDALDRVD